MPRCSLPAAAATALSLSAGSSHGGRSHPSLPAVDERQGRASAPCLLGGWAYGAIYGSSDERRAALAGWLDFYDRRRPHGSLGRQPPLQRLEALRRNDLT